MKQDKTYPDPNENKHLPGRREVIASLAASSFLGAMGYAATTDDEWGAVASPDSLRDADGISEAAGLEKKDPLADLKGTMPKGKIGDQEFSRLIFGSNLIGGWAHARDLMYVSDLFRAYNTLDKIYETLGLAEKAGIDSMIVSVKQMDILNKYRKFAGGKIKTLCQVYPSSKNITEDIDMAIDNGVTTPYIQGAVCDMFVQKGDMDSLAKAVDHIKKQGYLAGIGAHSIEVPKACEKAGIDADYYVKTCHHSSYWSATPIESREEFSVDRRLNRDHDKFHDNMFDVFPKETIKFMEKVKKPWIGFKVLAGGAIHPKDGFKYAFENGTDFICVGMFDFQVVDDVNIALEALEKAKERKRPWYA